MVSWGAAGAVTAGDDWSDFWDRVAVERAKTAPRGTQIASADIPAFETGRSAVTAAADVLDSRTWTRMRSNALAKFSSEPPRGMVLVFR